MSGQGPRKSIRLMTGPELEEVRRDLVYKAHDMGFPRETCEDLAGEAILCFYRWADGGEGSQLSHAIIHAQAQLFGWKGTGKAAKARRDYEEVKFDDLPTRSIRKARGKLKTYSEDALIAGIDGARALTQGDATLMAIFVLSELVGVSDETLALRYGLTVRTLRRRVRQFRKYLEHSVR